MGVRLVEPAHNVELRADRHGHEHVVFAFPYRAEIVDAVRAIPGRRFDWDAKEWWAPQADSTAPYVKGVLERFPALIVADDVHQSGGQRRVQRRHPHLAAAAVERRAQRLVAREEHDRVVVEL